MALAHHTPLVRTDDVEAAVVALRDRGRRLSAARRLVLEALFAAERPVSAEEIAAGVGGRVPRSDLASTYRNLDVLEELGLVRHFHTGHGPALFVLARDSHDLVVCERCGERTFVDGDVLEPVRAHVRSVLGFEPRFGHFPLCGLCARCAA